MNELKLLVIAGVSGSGKSTLEKNLLKYKPEKFHKLKQFTTRPKREEESDEYIFIQNDTFLLLRDKLIGRTVFHGNAYGTLPDFDFDKVNTLILNKEAIKDLMSLIYSEAFKRNLGVDKVQILKLGLDMDDDELIETVIRKGRDKESRLKEREVLDYCDHVYIIENRNYPSPESIERVVDTYYK